MEFFRQTIDSDALDGVFELPATLRNKKVEVIILPTDDSDTEPPKRERKLGFADIPPLPDSFFDPLPDDELELWGL